MESGRSSGKSEPGEGLWCLRHPVPVWLWAVVGQQEQGGPSTAWKVGMGLFSVENQSVCRGCSAFWEGEGNAEPAVLREPAQAVPLCSSSLQPRCFHCKFFSLEWTCPPSFSNASKWTCAWAWEPLLSCQVLGFGDPPTFTFVPLVLQTRQWETRVPERAAALRRFPPRVSYSTAETRKAERSTSTDAARFSWHCNCGGLASHPYPAMNHGNNPVHARALLPHVPACTSSMFTTVWIAWRAVQCAACSLLQCHCQLSAQQTPAPQTGVISAWLLSDCSLCLSFPNWRKVNWGSQGIKRVLVEYTHVYKQNTQLYNGKAQFEMFVK